MILYGNDNYVLITSLSTYVIGQRAGIQKAAVCETVLVGQRSATSKSDALDRAGLLAARVQHGMCGIWRGKRRVRLGAAHSDIALPVCLQVVSEIVAATMIAVCGFKKSYRIILKGERAVRLRM